MKKIFNLLVFLIALNGSSQKVGLVLSGGAAKGLAHIGVIKALEENNVPIDYIVGTSMGAIVGGMYSAGYSPHEIEEIVLSKNFQNWINGQFDEKYNYYFTKRDDNGSILTVDIALDSTLNAQINSNIANDRAINFVLSEMLAQASKKSDYNFDSLFIAFRAIASDIFTQKTIILKDGTVNEALRASLTVPVFYRPIKIKGKYLFDGGIYNNFPVDIMLEEFDPDLIIGSNVSSKNFQDYPFDQQEELINNPLIYSLIDNSDPASVGENGIYIEPILTGYNSFDFDKVKQLIDSGYNATLLQISDIIKSISKEQTQEDITEKRNKFKSDFDPLIFSSVQFNGLSIGQKRFVKSLFRSRKKELTLEDVKKGYYKLTSNDYFKDIFPNMLSDGNGGYILDISAKPRKNLRLEFGGTIATRSISEIFLGARFHHFNRILFDHSANFYAGNFYTSAHIKSRIILPVLSQFYIEPEFTFNQWDYLDSDDFFIDDKSPTPIVQIDRKYGISIGLPVSTHYKLDFQTAYITNRDRFGNNPEVSSTDTLDLLKLDGMRYGFEFSKNSLNRKQYASKGSKLSASFDYFDLVEEYIPGNTSVISSNQEVDRNWVRAKIELEHYINFGKYTYGYQVEGVVSNQPFFSNFTGTLINTPAYYPLQDSRTLFLQKFRAHNYVSGGIRNIFHIKNNLDFRIEGYLFKAFKNITEGGPQVPEYDSEFKTIYFAATGTGVYHSPIGPISLSVNYYDDNEKQFGVLLHIGYLIFNKRSMD